GTVRSITVSALLAAVFMAAAQFGPASFIWCYAASGLFFGTIFPTISAVASESFPERTGTVLGLLFGAAGVGAMAAAWLIGVIADRFGLQWGFALVLFCLLLTTAAMVGYAYM
ncbi:MAG: MFS transporter, partial [Bacilli bacterium]